MAEKESKLKIITRSLETDPNVVVLPFREDNANELRKYFTEGLGGGNKFSSYVLSQPGQGHEVVIHVAPKRGLYTGAELQKFMDGIIPQLKPSEVNRFSQDIENSPEYFLSVASFNFRETHGREKVTLRRVCELYDDVFKNDFNFKNGKKTVEEEKTLVYERVIRVRIFPNEEIGKNALKKYCDSLKDETRGKDLGAILYVSLAEIQKYEPKIIQKLKASGQTRFI